MSPPRTGRPPVDNPRTANVQVRCTPDEKAALAAAAATAGKPLAEWLREVGLRAARRTR